MTAAGVQPRRARDRSAGVASGTRDHERRGDAAGVGKPVGGVRLDVLGERCAQPLGPGARVARSSVCRRATASAIRCLRSIAPCTAGSVKRPCVRPWPSSVMVSRQAALASRSSRSSTRRSCSSPTLGSHHVEDPAAEHPERLRVVVPCLDQQPSPRPVDGLGVHQVGSAARRPRPRRPGLLRPDVACGQGVGDVLVVQQPPGEPDPSVRLRLRQPAAMRPPGRRRTSRRDGHRRRPGPHARRPATPARRPGPQARHLSQQLFGRGRVEGPQRRLGHRVQLGVQPRDRVGDRVSPSSCAVLVMALLKH